MSKERKAKRSGLKGFLDEYNEKPTGKGQAGNIALKTGVDLLGVTGGGLTAAAAGGWSVPLGVVLIIIGHRVEDKSGILRMAGAASLTYGVAKYFEFKEAKEKAAVNGIEGLAGVSAGIKSRLTNFKNEIMGAYFLDKIFKKGDEKETRKMEVDTPENVTVGAIDLSALDMFDDFNQQEADEFEASQQVGDEPRQLPDFSMDYQAPQSSEVSFAMIDDDDDPDLTDI
jgi:hypothetical protein